MATDIVLMGFTDPAHARRGRPQLQSSIVAPRGRPMRSTLVATALSLAVVSVMTGGCVRSESPAPPLSVEAKLAEGVPFSVSYTATTIEELRLSFPPNLGGHELLLGEEHSASVPGVFRLSIGEGDETREVILEKAKFSLPSIDLPLDLGGGGKPEQIPTGEITMIGDGTDSPGELNAETGEVRFDWQAQIAFPALRDLGSEALNASASTTGRFDPTDGYLSERTYLTVEDGPLAGLAILCIYSKPPPDIPCAVTSDCLSCANRGAGCRVGGTAGLCQQVPAGCACRGGGKTLMIYRCT